jgi:hypothetical protein
MLICQTEHVTLYRGYYDRILIFQLGGSCDIYNYFQQYYIESCIWDWEQCRSKHEVI